MASWCSLPSEPRKVAGRPGEGQGTADRRRGGEGGEGEMPRAGIGRNRIRGKKIQVENVDEVEKGGKNCAQFLFFLSAFSDFSDFSCQDPIDIFISRP
jgi:hypothetical protein